MSETSKRSVDDDAFCRLVAETAEVGCDAVSGWSLGEIVIHPPCHDSQTFRIVLKGHNMGETPPRQFMAFAHADRRTHASAVSLVARVINSLALRPKA